MIQAIVWAFVPTSGCRDVRVGADDAFELGGEPAGQGFELLRAHRARIAGHAAFGAAERDVDQGRLPGHPHRQRPDVIEVGRRVESQAALGRTARDVVLDAVALEDLDRAVIALDGEVDRELALGYSEDGAQAGLERDVVGCGIELRERRRQGIGSRGLRGSRRGLLHQRLQVVASSGCRQDSRARTNETVDRHERRVNADPERVRVHAFFIPVPEGFQVPSVASTTTSLGRAARQSADPSHQRGP